MQATDSGKNEQLVDDTINFRPSPNFKHMKKYLKSKFEEDQQSVVERKIKVNTVVQPPLPPNSPPPDSPITLKQEVEDDGYEPAAGGGYSPGVQDAPLAAPAPAPAPAPAAADADAPLPDCGTQKKFIMCKDWVRGTCSRGAACLYVHELDKSQLKGVYRFCRDYENARCERPVCNFAHATTFEKEHFYRTAYLPPHALQHVKPAAPPGTGTVPAHEVQSELPQMFANPPPPAMSSGAVVPVGPGGAGGGGGGGAVAGAGAHEARLPLDAFGAAALPAVTPAAAASVPPIKLKREWREHDDFSSPPRDLDPEPLIRKCKNCEITTVRLQHSKAQVASALRSSQELDDKLEQLIKKFDRLQVVLKTLLKPRRVLEHVNNNFLGGMNRLSLGDETNKDVLLSQMKVLLAKILLGSETDGREKGRDLTT